MVNLTDLLLNEDRPTIIQIVGSDAITFTNKTLDDISNYIGANHIHYRCRNNSGGILAAGTVVRASGTQPGTDYVVIEPVTDPQTQVAIGIIHSDLANNAVGLLINTGTLNDHVDTSAWAAGTILYPNSSGGLTNVKPTSGQYQACAVVTRSHANQGTILVEFTEPKYFASTTKPGYVQLVNDLVTNDATKAATAAQVFALKGLLDALGAVVVLKGVWDASAGMFPTSTKAGESWIVSVGGTVNGIIFTANDRIVAIVDSASTTVYVGNWHKLDYTDEVLLAGNNVFTGQQTFKELKETVYNLTGTVIDPANGTIQWKSLTANTTFTEALEDGQSVTLRLASGSSWVVGFPTMTWVTAGGNVQPTLTASDVIVFWKEGTTLYGAYVGSGV